MDIGNVINHKKDFIIESNNSAVEKSEFQFSDADSAKNAWRFCVLQHMFYREYEMENLGVDRTDKGMTSFQQGQVEVIILNLFNVYRIIIINRFIVLLGEITADGQLRRHNEFIISSTMGNS